MNEIYEKVLNVLGLSVEDGLVMMDGEPWKVSGTKVALPNTLAARELRIVDGKPTVIIFNPIQDNVLKVSPVMRKLVKTYNMRMELALNVVMNVGYHSTATNVSLPPVVSMFIATLANAKGSAKKLMDDVAIKSLIKALEWAVINDKYMIQLFPVNGITVGGEKVISAITYTSPLLDEVNDDESEVHNILKRRKDRELLMYGLQHILTYLSTDDENVLSYSNVEVGPMFTALLKGITRGNMKINKLLKGLSRVDEDMCKQAMLPDEFSSDFIASIQEMEAEAGKVVRVDGTDTVRKNNGTVQQEPVDGEVIPGTTIKRKSHGQQQGMQQGGYQLPPHLMQPQQPYGQPTQYPPQPMHSQPQQYGQPRQMSQHGQQYGTVAPFTPETIEVTFDERSQRFYDRDGYEVPQDLVLEDQYGRLFTELPPQPQTYGQPAPQSVQFRR